ncbi:hypothetical protein F5B21DRAFT_468930 [Xylaria acuta]|nr:hypothetical protein F5B21DRAFT_468930 [Xylaria acuta]
MVLASRRGRRVSWGWWCHCCMFSRRWLGLVDCFFGICGVCWKSGGFTLSLNRLDRCVVSGCHSIYIRLYVGFELDVLLYLSICFAYLFGAWDRSI